jgi:hypothetical protein
VIDINDCVFIGALHRRRGLHLFPLPALRRTASERPAHPTGFSDICFDHFPRTFSSVLIAPAYWGEGSELSFATGRFDCSAFQFYVI